MNPYFAAGRALVAAIALSMALAACGSGHDDDDDTTSPPDTENTQPAPQLRCAP